MLLVTTPLQVLLFDPWSGTTELVRNGDGEYFGLSWGRDALVLTHSNQDNEALKTFADYRAEPKGNLSWIGRDGRTHASPAHLVQPHQIECVDGLVLAANSGMNCLTVHAEDGAFVRHVRLNDVLWDKLEDGSTGNHFNSVHRRGERLYVLAHNHERPSAVHELSWPGMEPLRVITTRARWAHNLWVGEHGIVVCDSKDGSLLAAESGETLWRPDEERVITRGLAVTAEHLFVGRSEYGTRGERKRNDGGVWVVDRRTLCTLASYRFPGSGCVNDLRALHAPDEAHTDVPFERAWLDALARRSLVGSLAYGLRKQQAVARGFLRS